MVELDARLLAFLGVAILVVVTPGADMALVTKYALAGGRRTALQATLGIMTGLVIWAMLSAIGLAALLNASATAFTVLKVAGAVYLVAKHALAGGQRTALQATLGIMTGLVIWAMLSAIGLAALLNASATAFTVLKVAGAVYLVAIGLQTIWHARQSPGELEDAAAMPVTRGRRTSGIRAYRQGLFSNLLNPKPGVFYTTFLPQFISADDPALPKTALLALVHLVISLAWLAWYIHVVIKASAMLNRPRVRRWLDRVTGAVLVALGLRLAVERP